MKSQKSFLVIFSLSLLFLFVACTDNPIIPTPPPVVVKKLAFPGAEGGGKYSVGGRGGLVYYVTTLEDDPIEGSLRYGLMSLSGNRTILFKVSGTIRLKAKLFIKNGNVTIAGQSAPGDGICLRDNSVYIQSSNVIIRFMRFRMGDVTDVEDDALGAQGTSSVIIDHCSMSWSTDECGSFYNNTDFTLQWCLLSESLRNSIHDKGTHGYGGIWGGNNASFHHNLLAHHDSRNPRFDHDGVSSLRGPVDFVNNVIYNWGGNSSYGGENRKVNMVNNYYKSGPASSSKYRIFNPAPSTGLSPFCGDEVNTDGRYYITGNYVNGYPATTTDNWSTGVQGITSADKTYFKVTSPFTVTAVPTQTAETAYASVLLYVGASLKRDAVDTRIISDVTNGTYSTVGSNGSSKGLIDSQGDTGVGAWPTLNATTPPTDTDADGMPDDWEDANSLDKNNPADRNTKTLNADYTNLEVYLNSLVQHLFPE